MYKLLSVAAAAQMHLLLNHYLIKHLPKEEANLQAMSCLLHKGSSLATQCMYPHVVVHLLPEVGSLSRGFGWRGEDVTVQCMQARQVDGCIGGIIRQASHRTCTPVRVTQ